MNKETFLLLIAAGCTTLSASAFGGVCGDPAAGDCCVANGTPGCDELRCCEAICAVDQFCCDFEWDALCADAAIVSPDCSCVALPEACCFPDETCQDLDPATCIGQGGTPQGVGSTCATAVCGPPCGDPNAGDCCTDNNTPGCDSLSCCEAICALDEFCCEQTWDSMCAEAAAADLANCPQCNADALVSADGVWVATIDEFGQPNNVLHPENGEDILFETLVYAAHSMSGQLSERIESTWTVTEGPTISPDLTEAHTRLVHPSGQLSIDIDIEMISGPTGGALMKLTCHNKGQVPLSCKLFLYGDLDIPPGPGAGLNDEAELITDPDGSIRAIAQIDLDEPFRAFWLGGCKPYKSFSIREFGSLRDALDAGLAQLDGIDSTAPGPADHTAALSSEKIQLEPGGASVMRVGLGAPDFSGCCPADLTGDGTVGPPDLAIILGNWGPVPPNDPIADLNNDGVVGPADLAIILGNWGPCP